MRQELNQAVFRATMRRFAKGTCANCRETNKPIDHHDACGGSRTRNVAFACGSGYRSASAARHGVGPALTGRLPLRDYLVFAIVLLMILAGCAGHRRKSHRSSDTYGFQDLFLHYAAPDNPLRSDSARADQYRRDGTIQEPEGALP